MFIFVAWDLGVMTTKVGQTIELITDSKYAYGELGRCVFFQQHFVVYQNLSFNKLTLSVTRQG
jgi:hypothetical protein